MTYWRAVLVLLVAACTHGSGDGSPPLPIDGSDVANATFNWTIVKNGVMSTCANADADEVKIEATPEDPNTVPVNHTFQCVLLPGTLSLAPGRYSISAQLYDNINQQMRAFVPAQALTVPATGTAPAMMFKFTL